MLRCLSKVFLWCTIAALLAPSGAGLTKYVPETRGVTLHIPLMLSVDTFEHISTIEDTVTAMNHCFAEILVTFDQANKTIRAWDNVFRGEEQNLSTLPATAEDLPDEPLLTEIAPKLACAAISAVNATANRLEARCGQSVSRRVIAMQIGSALVDTLLLDIIRVPIRQLSIAPLVMWKNTASFIFGIFLAKNPYVFHLDSDRVLSSRAAKFNETMAAHSSDPLFVPFALDLFERYQGNVSAVMMPDCSDNRTGMHRWKDGRGDSHKTLQFAAGAMRLNGRSFGGNYLFQRAYNHKSTGKRWYFEQNKQPCGRSNSLLSDVESCKTRKDTAKYQKIHSCGKTQNFFSTQAFIVKTVDILKRIRYLRIKQLLFPWRAQIECILESASSAYHQFNIKATKYLFAHQNITGVCKRYPKCHKPHHLPTYSVNLTNSTVNCTKGIGRKEAEEKGEVWNPCLRWYVNYTHPVPGCSNEKSSLEEAVSAATKEDAVRLPYDTCMAAGLHASILNHGWQHGGDPASESEAEKMLSTLDSEKAQISHPSRKEAKQKLLIKKRQDGMVPS